MPELPEVETTRRGISPHLVGKTLSTIKVRNALLRWPVPASLGRKLRGAIIENVGRRGKYLMLDSTAGTVLIHLGMSGSLRIVDAASRPEKHDHLDLVLSDGRCLRFRDPRRFGSVLWAGSKPLEHKLLRRLGPEPLGAEFSGKHLYLRSRQRKIAVKAFIMDSHNVVGVGNIYASESLYLSGINPRRAAGRISLVRYEKLVLAIREVLTAAIESGGTTLRDFVNGEGAPGYFAQSLAVYGREGEKCYSCGEPVKHCNLAQRSTFYCSACQS